MNSRVAYLGFGALGRKVVRDLIDQGLHNIVAAIDPAPGMEGKPLSEVVEGAPNLPIRPALSHIPDMNSVDLAIVTTLSDLRDCMPTFRALLRNGVSVLSTCEELVYPRLRHPELARELHELACENQCAVMGVGINPGFLMDAFPLFASTLCRSIESILVERVQDASIRRVPFQRKIGATLSPQQFEDGLAAGKLGHVGLGESLHLLAEGFGVELDEWEEVITPVIATREMESGLGIIQTGQLAGIRQVARGRKSGVVLMELVFHAAIGAEDPRDQVTIQGDPPLQVRWPGGVHGDMATSAVVINAVNALLKAQPGLHNLATLPLAPCARIGT